MFREELPVLVEHLPDLFHDEAPGAQHHGEWGVGVIEAIQQHLK